MRINFLDDRHGTVSGAMQGGEFTTSIERFGFGCWPTHLELTGEYEFENGTVFYENGAILRTEDGTISVVGEMTITQTWSTQHLIVSGNEVNSSTSYTPFYVVRRENGLLHTPYNVLFFWAYGNKLTTMTYVDLYGGYTEWDVWRKTNDKVNQTRNNDVADPTETPTGGVIGYLMK